LCFHERLSPSHITAKIEYQPEGEGDVYVFPQLVLLSNIEIGAFVYVSLFPFEELTDNDCDESDVHNHLSNRDFFLIR
jgi:hypothetical protein